MVFEQSFQYTEGLGWRLECNSDRHHASKRIDPSANRRKTTMFGETKTRKSVSREMTFRSTISQPVKYGLYFVGIWPGTPFPGLHKLYWIVSMAVWQFCQYKYIVTHFKNKPLMEMIECLSITLPYTLLILKLCIIWTNHGVLREIISTMEEDCVKYAVIDTNNVISKTADFSYRLTSTIAFLYLASATFYAAGGLAFLRSNDTMPRELLLNMDLPFDASESPSYELVVTAQVLHQTASSYTFGMFSALLVMMILHVGCLIDILCDILVQISAQEEDKLRFVAIRHQEIVVLAERIEKLFTHISLCQLMANTLVTCCLGYLVITAVRSDNELPLLLKSISAYTVICLEIFVYCCAGEYLNTKSKMIIEAAYQMAWYDLHPNVSRQLVLLILKSQKGLPLTFGRFSTLSLRSFTRIMKSSASYMSVLLAI
ncbi:odorant receptor 82a-like [Halictus rubicundus]|uniref:odorant receptor 82a-like n=1 Tax=Halictus rubicundus TaxID=77578 RepID=UPI0040354560